MGIYDFTVKTWDGGEVSLSRYAGSVLLIVNTATGDAFTPQYKALQALYEEAAGLGFEILDFPCDQFAGQAPGTDEEIRRFRTERYGVTFPQFAKTEVRGENTEPLFRFLAGSTRFARFTGIRAPLLNAAAKRMDRRYRRNSQIKWNFTKFLIDRDGEVLARFEPTVSMDNVRKAVKAAL